MGRIYTILVIIISLSLITCERQKIEQKQTENKEARYAVAVKPTPVLNTPDFSSVFGGNDGRTLKLNAKKHVEEVEFVALPGTIFTIEKAVSKGSHEILKVKTEDYPYEKQEGYYIDSRFVEKKVERPAERKKSLPDKGAIINRLLAAKGAIYVWGGNYVKGIPEMLEFYPVRKKAPSELSNGAGQLSEDVRDRWMLKGVDCSGLLYEATDGYIPRNIESLFNYGSPVDVKGMSPEEIVKKLKPLDIIVYQRHMVIVLSSRDAIESSMAHGVHIISLTGRLRALGENMLPGNDYKKDEGSDKFVARRWYSE